MKNCTKLIITLLFAGLVYSQSNVGGEPFSKSNKISSQEISSRFLNSPTPIIGYIKNNIFFIDLKAIPYEQISLLMNSINEVL